MINSIFTEKTLRANSVTKYFVHFVQIERDCTIAKHLRQVLF